MKLVFYTNFLNHHQVMVADELFELLGNEFAFVATMPVDESLLKGGSDYSTKRDYCVRAYASEQQQSYAMLLAREAEVCVFGADAMPYEIVRATEGKGLSFEICERWLKQGWLNLASPRLQKWLLNYHRYFKRAGFYRLCASAFCKDDDSKFRAYKGHSYKWGYFTKVERFDVEAYTDVSTSNITPLMWCSRYLMWKHPELPVLLAQNLKKRGYHFVLDMFGSGEYEKQAKQLAGKLGVEDVVKFRGTMPNEQLMREMRKNDIFLFTSDRNEGWGAVANECMENGCVLVASDAIGSVPYLVKDGVNGIMFRSASTKTSFENPDRIALDDLTGKVAWLLEHKDSMKVMQQKAARTMQDIWSPKCAAQNLLQLIDDLQNGRETSIQKGPCSKA